MLHYDDHVNPDTDDSNLDPDHSEQDSSLRFVIFLKVDIEISDAIWIMDLH
jgi:hypothetical protein